MGWIVSLALFIRACLMGDISADATLLASGLFAIAGSLPHIVKLQKKDE